ncbi:MAG: hypothetical protein ACKVWR_12395 [Acidimicrobiales bacterium]
MNVDLSVEQLAQLDQRAARHGVTAAELAAGLLGEWLELSVPTVARADDADERVVPHTRMRRHPSRMNPDGPGAA